MCCHIMRYYKVLGANVKEGKEGVVCHLDIRQQKEHEDMESYEVVKRRTKASGETVRALSPR